NTALSYETDRQLAGTVEADDLYHTAGHKGQAQSGGKKALGRRACGRRKKREPGRGHDDKDRPAIIAWVSRQGAVVIQATRDFTVQTVQKAADLAMQAGSRLYTDSASSYRALKGYVHDYVNHTQKEYARGDVHENRAECLFSFLKPYLRVFRGVSKCNLPGYVGFFQFLRNFRQQNAFEQAGLILRAALDPAIARIRLSRFKFAGPPTPRDTEVSNAYAIIHDSLGPVCLCSLIGINSVAFGVGQHNPALLALADVDPAGTE